jgi:hypothetical protein
MSSSQAQRKKQATPANAPAVMADFVLVELRAGLGLAAFARHSLQKARYLQASKQKAGAIQAHRLALRFLSQATPTKEERAMIERQLARLQDCISHLEILEAKAKPHPSQP